MKAFSKYTLEARLFPTAIGLLPFYLWQFFYLANHIPSDLYGVKILGNITLTTVVLYFVSEFFVRYPSKILEDHLFKNRKNFPTTRLLLFSDNEYSDEFKEQFRKKTSNDFSLNLPNQIEESRDEEESRKKIKECIGLIIKRVGEGQLVLRHNISYGFFRNLWGASCVGFVFSIVLGVTFYLQGRTHLAPAFLLAAPYALYLVFGKKTVKYFAEMYAKKLLEEYMELK